MKQIMELLASYGAGTLLTAVVITVVTGIVKFPIKKFAAKFKNSHAITRFITFLPLFVGFGATALGTWLEQGGCSLADRAFYVRWLSSVSLSLAMYAFWEKFVPSKAKIFSEAELAANKKLAEELKEIVSGTAYSAAQVHAEKAVFAQELETETAPEVQAVKMCRTSEEISDTDRVNRIILAGGGHVKITK
ncbi:MAG: hypothetical protein HFE25_02930 [Clostridia bacterium]|jgi:hypothetical protein|nr:hypothetical protein [Clostridia bacterium]